MRKKPLRAPGRKERLIKPQPLHDLFVFLDISEKYQRNEIQRRRKEDREGINSDTETGQIHI